MAMPDAKGLFHRGIVMSGSFPAGTPAADAQAVTAATMAELGLAPSDVAGLQKAAVANVIAAANTAVRKLSKGPGGMPSAGAPRPTGFGPVIDGAVLPEDWATAAPRISADVPMIVGNVRDEFRPFVLSFDESSLPKAVPPQRRDQATAIIAALHKAFPDLPPTELAAIMGGMFMRNMSVDQARKKHALGAAPVFSYWYLWSTAILDGTIGAPHGSDIPAAFDNSHRCDQFTGNTPQARRLANIVSQAWVNFAATGNPSQPGYAWPPYDPDRVATMVFDNRVRVENDPAGEARRLLA
jgi:para-nitrobenzyl esterase